MTAIPFWYPWVVGAILVGIVVAVAFSETKQPPDPPEKD